MMFLKFGLVGSWEEQLKNTKESPKNTKHNVKIFERKLALLKLQIQEPQSRHYRFGRYKDASWFLRSVAHTCWILHRT
jgi:hypothetical protein